MRKEESDLPQLEQYFPVRIMPQQYVGGSGGGISGSFFFPVPPHDEQVRFAPHLLQYRSPKSMLDLLPVSFYAEH